LRQATDALEYHISRDSESLSDRLARDDRLSRSDGVDR